MDGGGGGDSFNLAFPREHLLSCTRGTHQHEVDVEAEYLVAHVHAEVVAEMVPQVGEGARRALEVRARHLHTLDTQQRLRGGGVGAGSTQRLIRV